MRIRLRYRLLGPVLVLVVGQLLAAGLLAWRAVQAVDVELDTRLQTLARTLTEPPTFPLTSRILDQMKGLSGAEFVWLSNDGRAVSTLPNFAGPLEARPDLRLGSEQFRVVILTFPDRHPNAGDQLGILYPESSRRAAISQAILPPALLAMLSVLLSLVLVFYLSLRVTQRIATLQQRTEVIASGDFQPLELRGPDDELNDLAQAINRMSTQLAAQQARLGEAERLRVLAQFSGGLAHQLRNAAAGAKLALQLHLADHPGGDPEAIQVALRQLARIESNLQQFLTLGKPPEFQPQPLDLVALIRQCVALSSPQCRHTGTALSLELPETCNMIGDTSLLNHLVGNLLSNAVEAAGPGGAVRVLLEMGESVRLIVADNGPGPPSGIQQRLFEAFVTGKPQGIGLGLAVAQQAALAHGGTITWSRDSGWTWFRVELPAAQSPQPPKSVAPDVG